MAHYYAIAEPDGSGWYLTFPGGAGYSHAGGVEHIVSQARDWLASAGMHGGQLPRSIEEGALPPSDADLADYDRPLVVVIPFEPTTARRVPA
jgi:hypothetical protein